MHKLQQLVREVMQDKPVEWKLEDRALSVWIGEGTRHQTMHLDRQEEMYFIWTVVLGEKRVTKTAQGWRKLALLAWQRNADHEVVTFGFDRKDRLIGLVRHPVDHLDAEELEVYLRALSRECDRFEYLLTGQDVF